MSDRLRLPKKLLSRFPPDVQRRLLELRRDLHRHPELAFEEGRTAQRLHAELALLQPAELARVAGTGVVARISGAGKEGATVAVRADIDALPIQEETGLDWSSEQAGVMHACGHDVHATWAVAAAHLLRRHPAAGDVVILLQPAEEVGKGARAVLASGVLDGVEAIFAAHVDRRFEVGQVVAQAGPVAASADTFEIVLRGRGAHGARPHEAADPIVGAAALIGALQTIVSRRLDPARPAVVTVGSIHAGSAANVIPAEAHLAGTLRATDAETRSLLHREVRKIAASTAAAHDLQAEVRIEEGTPAIVNPERDIGWARQAVEALLGKEALVPLGAANMGGEDFALYMEKMRGCFLRIGAREPGGEVTAAHSSRFLAADESIFVGAAVLAETARIASARLRAVTGLV